MANKVFAEPAPPAVSSIWIFGEGGGGDTVLTHGVPLTFNFDNNALLVTDDPIELYGGGFNQQAWVGYSGLAELGEEATLTQGVATHTGVVREAIGATMAIWLGTELQLNSYPSWWTRPETFQFSINGVPYEAVLDLGTDIYHHNYPLGAETFSGYRTGITLGPDGATPILFYIESEEE